uniref:HAD family phosphatase n=1 Tax=Anaerolinea thermolimosa TaxID=229919 RepID=A0A7C4PT54_9CHLR
MIELFVFDLGNVILPFDHTQIAHKLFAHSSSAGGCSPREIFRYIFDLEEGFINPFEEGVFSSLEFYARIRDRYGLGLDFEAFREIWNNIFWENPEVNEVIVRLKEMDCPLFLLSNTNELHFSHVLERYPVIHLFDEWILSFEVGAKKPKRRIYEAIFEKTDVRADRILYIDDVESNVRAAEALGMKGMVFREAADLWSLMPEVHR